MSESEAQGIDVVGAVDAVIVSHKKFVDFFVTLERACTTPPQCVATIDGWIAVVEYLDGCTDELVNLSRTMRTYAEHVNGMRRQLFLGGFYEALRQTDRLDLLDMYPEVEKIAAVVEAQRILMEEEPPTMNDNDTKEQ